jgi:hypothetical protein
VKAGLCLAALLISTAAFAQPSSPGPYIVDLRGAMSGAPGGGSFYPTVSAEAEVLAPQRAFGFSAGAHMYPFHLGIARVGLGVDLMRTRGTATSLSHVAAAMSVTTLAPQLSLNFGTREGWSYLSGGFGMAQTRARVDVPATTTTSTTNPPVTVTTPASTSSRERQSPAINIGGGARWFRRERVAVGFDVRFHRMTNPSKQIVGLSVGLSVR